jgi:hypothetical protein
LRFVEPIHRLALSRRERVGEVTVGGQLTAHGHQGSDLANTPLSGCAIHHAVLAAGLHDGDFSSPVIRYWVKIHVEVLSYRRVSKRSGVCSRLTPPNTSRTVSTNMEARNGFRMKCQP